MRVIGKSRAQDVKAIMVNGSQFDWYAPAYTYGIGLHSAGYDVTSNTPLTYPGLVFGYNGATSQGSTAGFGDDVDILTERLSTKKPGYYLHNGKRVKVLSREETITVKNGQAETFTVWHTVYGNTLQTDQMTRAAYAKSRAWDSKEVVPLLTQTHQMKVKNWQEWTQQAAKQALTIDWYYVDANSNIGYIHTGVYPDRQSGHDPRLSVPGMGKWDRKGLPPSEMNPKACNPLSEYIVDWNNSPQKDYPASDLFAFLWGGANRVAEIDRLLEQKPRLTADQAQDVIRQTSRQDLNLRLPLSTLQAAISGLTQSGPRHQLMGTLTRWDGISLFNDDGKAWQQPGSAILNVWLISMLKRIMVAAVLMPLDKWYSTSGYETAQDDPTGSLNISVEAKILYEAMQGDKSSTPRAVDLFVGRPQQRVALAALEGAWETSSKRHGNNVNNWKTSATVLTFRVNNFSGVPQVAAEETCHQAEYQNRGTENDMIVFSPTISDRPAFVWDVVAPGQSGLTALDGTVNRHYEDQLKIYEDLGRKLLWLTKQDVEAHKGLQEALHVQR